MWWSPHVASILDRFKKFVGPFVTPIFVIDDTPPPLENDTAIPAQIDRTTGGIKVHIVGGGGGGGGGGDASSANQVLILNSIDAVYDTLQLVGLETTGVQIRDAIIALGDGATLADLAAAFTTDAITQADILTALEASQIDLASVKAGVDLLVPDLDAVRVALETRLPTLLVGGRLDVNVGNTVPISAVAFPLPTGAATETSVALTAARLGGMTRTAFDELRTVGSTPVMGDTFSSGPNFLDYQINEVGTGIVDYDSAYGAHRYRVEANGDIAGAASCQSTHALGAASGKICAHVQFGPASNLVVYEAGVFDDNNGFFLRQTGTGVLWKTFLVIRSNASGVVTELPIDITAAATAAGLGETSPTRLSDGAFVRLEGFGAGNGGDGLKVNINGKVLFDNTGSNPLYPGFMTPGGPAWPLGTFDLRLRYHVRAIGAITPNTFFMRLRSSEFSTLSTFAPRVFPVTISRSVLASVPIGGAAILVLRPAATIAANPPRRPDARAINVGFMVTYVDVFVSSGNAEISIFDGYAEAATVGGAPTFARKPSTIVEVAENGTTIAGADKIGDTVRVNTNQSVRIALSVDGRAYYDQRAKRVVSVRPDGTRQFFAVFARAASGSADVSVTVGLEARGQV